MTRKKIFRCYLITDYEKEETWLREMHAKGWKVVKAVIPGIYTFEQCEPEDVVYRLEFSDEKAAQREGFQAMCEDYGWSYLFSMNGWGYYCKKADSSVENNELFTDDWSRMQMIKQVAIRRFLPLTLIFVFLVIPNVCRGLFGRIAYHTEVITIFWYILGIIYLLLCVRLIVGFMRLTKKYGRRKYEK